MYAFLFSTSNVFAKEIIMISLDRLYVDEIDGEPLISGYLAPDGKWYSVEYGGHQNMYETLYKENSGDLNGWIMFQYGMTEAYWITKAQKDVIVTLRNLLPSGEQKQFLTDALIEMKIKN